VHAGLDTVSGNKALGVLPGWQSPFSVNELGESSLYSSLTDQTGAFGLIICTE
jgi:hypothetical protein